MVNRLLAMRDEELDNLCKEGITKEKRVNPEETANIFSRLTFWCVGIPGLFAKKIVGFLKKCATFAASFKIVGYLFYLELLFIFPLFTYLSITNSHNTL